MNSYIVHLNIQIGEVQKRAVKLIEAESPAAAETRAIEREAHNALDWDGEGAFDGPFGEMYYKVAGVQEVVSADVPVLKRYL